MVDISSLSIASACSSVIGPGSSAEAAWVGEEAGGATALASTSLTYFSSPAADEIDVFSDGVTVAGSSGSVT